jgi:cell division initiation protein
MKISPIDIRQHTFEKGFRGYDLDEVNAFLNSLSQEWERVMNENKMLKMQLEIAEKELNKLRDVEMTLFRTLKNAEDTSNQIAEQANRAAEKYIQESRQKTDETIVEARRKASMIIQDAENEAKYIREEIINELKSQERDFRAMEKYRDNLVVQLKSLANNTNEAVERFEKKFSKDSSFEQRMEEVKNRGAEEETAPAQDNQPATHASLENEGADGVKGVAVDTNPEELTAADAASDQEVRASEPTESAGKEATVAAQIAQDEATPADQPVPDPSGQHSPTDAAAEALAEIEKMARTRQQAQELEVAKEAQPSNDDAAKKAEGKGSFFDQIG